MSTRTMVITLEVREVPGGRDEVTPRRDVANAVASQLVPRLPVLSWTAEEQGAGVFARCTMALDRPEREPWAEVLDELRTVEDLMGELRESNNPDLMLLVDHRATLKMLSKDENIPRNLRVRADVLVQELREIADIALDDGPPPRKKAPRRKRK